MAIERYWEGERGVASEVRYIVLRTRGDANARWIRIGPMYSMMKTVVQESCGPASKSTSRPWSEKRRSTKILYEYLPAFHHLLVVDNQCFSVLQDLLLLGVEETETFRVPSSCSLCEIVLDILDCSLVRDLNAGGQLLNWLLRSWVVYVS
jgi:hypothetical protein